MTNLLDLAARLEAACDITGKPIGRHMVPGLKAMSTAFAESDEQEARELAETHDCMARCIENEAKLFDDLAAVVKDAAAALRSLGIPGDPAFECMAYDAHCPSGTVRFQAPKDFPLAGGIFRIQRIRSATPEDTARFAHLPDAPEYQYEEARSQSEGASTIESNRDSSLTKHPSCPSGPSEEA